MCLRVLTHREERKVVCIECVRVLYGFLVHGRFPQGAGSIEIQCVHVCICLFMRECVCACTYVSLFAFVCVCVLCTFGSGGGGGGGACGWFPQCAAASVRVQLFWGDLVLALVT